MREIFSNFRLSKTNHTMFNKSHYFRAIAVVAVCLIGAWLAYPMLKGPDRLPIYNPSDVNEKLVDESVRWIRKDHKIADFSLRDQNGEEITQDTYEDKIYVADFFFTTCPTICIAMTKHMGTLQEEFANDDEVMLLSHSVMPKVDNVAQLRKYADEKGVNDAKWHLVTGEKAQIYDLARKSYFAAVTEGDGGEDDFIHTENFVLIDKKKRIRGFYDGTSKEDIGRLIGDINILKEEYQ